MAVSGRFSSGNKCWRLPKGGTGSQGVCAWRLGEPSKVRDPLGDVASPQCGPRRDAPANGQSSPRLPLPTTRSLCPDCCDPLIDNEKLFERRRL